MKKKNSKIIRKKDKHLEIIQMPWDLIYILGCVTTNSRRSINMLNDVSTKNMHNLFKHWIRLRFDLKALLHCHYRTEHSYTWIFFPNYLGFLSG